MPSSPYFKLNMPIEDVEGVFSLLTSKARLVEEAAATYDFYHIPGRRDTYARVEIQNISGGYQKFYLTIKQDREPYADICPNDVYARDESTIPLSEQAQGEQILGILGYAYTHRKIRNTFLFVYENIDIRVHLRYDGAEATYLEGRMELSSLEKDVVETFLDNFR